MRQQVTGSGLVFTAACVLVGVAAFISANNLLFLLLAAMLSTLLVSGFISRLSLAGLELDFVLPEQLSARRRIAGRILIRNDKRWFPSFSIHVVGSAHSAFTSAVYFPSIPARATLSESVEVYFDRRGTHKENSFQFSSRFPFGFTNRNVQVTLTREVLVYPCLDPQPGFEELAHSVAGEVQAHYRGRGHDFYRIRPYEHMESSRHVDWKATAHTGDLQVREFAREQEHLIDVVLDLDVDDGNRAWFEQAVDCCAYLCWRIAARGARVRFRTQVFDLQLPEEGDIYNILRYLALVSPMRGKPLPAPDDDNSFQIAFSARPSRTEESGWANARIISPGTLPAAASGPTAGNPAAKELDHGSGKSDRGGAGRHHGAE